MKKPLKHALASLAAMVLVCGAPLAKADPAGTPGTLDPIQFAAGSQSFVLSIGGTPATGGFVGTWNSANVVFWCIELTEYFGFAGTYAYEASEPDTPTFTLLGQLFNQAYGQVISPPIDEATKYSAAFQLAIWEIVYETTNPLNLSSGSGNFWVEDAKGHLDTVALANTWLANVGKFTDSYDLIWLHSHGHQDFVTFGSPFGDIARQDVPEPAPLMLLAAAFLAMVFVMRRKAVSTLT